MTSFADKRRNILARVDRDVTLGPQQQAWYDRFVASGSPEARGGMMSIANFAETTATPVEPEFTRSASTSDYINRILGEGTVPAGTPVAAPVAPAMATPAPEATPELPEDPREAFIQEVAAINTRHQASVRNASAKGGGQYDRNSQARANASYGAQNAALDIEALMDSYGYTQADLRDNISGSGNDTFMDLGVGNTVYGGNVNINTGTSTPDVRRDDFETTTGTIGQNVLAEQQDSGNKELFGTLALGILAAPLAAGLTGAGAGGALGGSLSGVSPMLTQAGIQGIGTGLIQGDAQAGLEAGLLSLGTQAAGKYAGDRLHAAAEQGGAFGDPNFVGDSSSRILDDFLPKGVAQGIGGVIDSNVTPIVDSIFKGGLDILGEGLGYLPEGLLEPIVGSKGALETANKLQNVLTGEGEVDYGQNPTSTAYDPNTGYSQGYNPETGAISPLVDPEKDVASIGDVIYINPETGEPELLPPSLPGLPALEGEGDGSGGGDGDGETDIEATSPSKIEEIMEDETPTDIFEDGLTEKESSDLLEGTMPGDTEDPNQTGPGGSGELEDSSPGSGDSEDPSPTIGQPTTEEEAPTSEAGGGAGALPSRVRRKSKDVDDELFRLARVMQVVDLTGTDRVSVMNRIKTLLGEKESLAGDATATLDELSTEYLQKANIKKTKKAQQQAAAADPITEAIEALAA